MSLHEFFKTRVQAQILHEILKNFTEKGKHLPKMSVKEVKTNETITVKVVACEHSLRTELGHNTKPVSTNQGSQDRHTKNLLILQKKKKKTHLNTKNSFVTLGRLG